LKKYGKLKMDKQKIETRLNHPEYKDILGGRQTTENLDALWLLKNAKKRADYDRLLSLIILNAHSFTNNELVWLSDFIKKPFVGQKGRRALDDVHIKIKCRYFTYKNLVAPISRKSAIREIAQEFKMSEDTARKHYDKAARAYKARHKKVETDLTLELIP
jgi:hypothetical protein